MRNIIAFYSKELPDRQCEITDSNGGQVVSDNPESLFAFMAKHNPYSFKVVYNLDTFMKPIKALMPAGVVKTLTDTERVKWGNIKLFYPELSNGGMLGIDYYEETTGNTFNKYEITIYDISGYFTGEPCASAGDVKIKGIELLTTLDKMGLCPAKLTTPAAIYEECILSKLPYPTIYTLPDSCIDMMEWAANYIREWRSVYRMGIFSYGVAKDYDLTSAYPSIIARLPNMLEAVFHYSKDGSIPDNATWGLIRANIDVKRDITFLVSEDGICRKGKRIDLISNEESNYCINTGHADVEPLEAWYFTLPFERRIFDYSMRKLYLQRNGSELQNRLAKAFSVSIWGKMHQYEMNSEKPGKYANFIYASMIASRCRLKVMEFVDIYHAQNHLIAVNVDGVILDCEAEIVLNEYINNRNILM